MGARRRRRRRPAPGRLRRWVRRQDRLTRRLLLAVVALGLLVVALGVLPVLTPRRPDAGRPSTAARPPRERAAPRARAPAVARHTVPHKPPPDLARRAPAHAPAPAPQRAEPGGAPVAAIVIDDLGQASAHIRQVADLGMPITVAVLPGLAATDETVREARERGIETLLHLPMEPVETDQNPGSGALRTAMTPAEIRQALRAHLAAVPGAIGVNNHMGSRYTADARALAPLMDELKGLGLFWLDSRTTGATVGAATARAHGLPVIERDVFLDAEVRPEFIRGQIRRLIRKAKQHGAAVGIGHPHPETLAALRELQREMRESGVAWVPLSSLMHLAPAPAGQAPVASTGGRGLAAAATRP